MAFTIKRRPTGLKKLLLRTQKRGAHLPAPYDTAALKAKPYAMDRGSNRARWSDPVSGASSSFVLVTQRRFSIASGADSESRITMNGRMGITYTLNQFNPAIVLCSNQPIEGKVNLEVALLYLKLAPGVSNVFDSVEYRASSQAHDE